MNAPEQQTAVILSVQLPKVGDVEHQSDLAELRRLLKTLGYKVVGAVTQRREALRPGTIIGQGKLLQLAQYTGGPGYVPNQATAPKGKHRPEVEYDDVIIEIPAHPDGEYPHADVVAVDHEISPRQARNIELATEASVLDRAGIIVEIFHKHAKTREARLQVEIARLTYVAPRLRFGSSGHDRQRGGVGGKGAGESALELDRRKVRDRIAELRGELADIERDDRARRSRRAQQRRVALVGYTNAGKSSLMRALTGNEVLVEDKLFATLGTTVRALHPEVKPRILVSDTVGFIKKLPHDLVASFRSTLEEAAEASLLLQVVDCSDTGFRGQLAVTNETLAEVGADAVESILVLNKIDKVDDFRRLSLEREFPDAIQLSALNADDVKRLHGTLLDFFERDMEPVELRIPYARGAVIGEIHASMRVIDEEWDEEGAVLTVKGSEAALDRVRTLLE